MKAAAAANQFMITIWHGIRRATKQLFLNWTYAWWEIIPTTSYKSSSCHRYVIDDNSKQQSHSGDNELDDEDLVSSSLSESAINNSPKQTVYTYCNYCRIYNNHCVALFQTTCLPTLSMAILTLYHLQLVSPTYQGKGHYWMSTILWKSICLEKRTKK